MAERRLHGLQRVLGTYSLASSAYGNVGSSIYYALGLVASFALGLTPIVFVISGAIFGGIIVVLALAAVNVRGVKESAGVNIGLAIADFATQVLLVFVGIVL